MNNFCKSIAAGVAIAIGSICYIGSPNIYGAVLFSIGLLIVMKYGLNLYTGKVGFAKTKKDWLNLIPIFLGNAVGSAVALVGNTEVAQAIMYAKLSKNIFTVFVAAAICGALIYFAVDQKNDYLTTLAVAAFIMLGGEHSIADMCFMFASRTFPWAYVPFLAVVILGNAVGAKLLAMFSKPDKKVIL